jgi:tetratricopeptide (TPR) repeat protein
VKECPVCGNTNIEEGDDTCKVCESDLRIAREMVQFPSSLKQLAYKAENNGEYTRAMTYYRLALEIEPHDEGLLRGLAKVLEKTGNPEEAIAIWKRLLDIIPEDSEGLERIDILEKIPAIPLPRSPWRPWIYVPLLLTLIVLGWVGHIFKDSYFAKKPVFTPEKNPVIASIETGTPETVPDTSPPFDVTTEKANGISREQDQVSESSEGVPHAKKTQPPVEETEISQPIKPSSLTPEPIALSKKMESLINEISQELPHGVEVETRAGGLFLEGPVMYPWDKHTLERKAKCWECTFVDLTGIKVTKPHAMLYQIKRGDSLYYLSRIFLGRSSAWPVLYDANRDTLADPNKLAIGQTIVVYTKMP